MTGKTPAAIYALVIGATLVVAGIVGFFYNAEFTDDSAARDAVVGILDVNGWHNVVHIGTGALGLLAFAGGARAARLYALGLSVVYVAIAVWGFILGTGHESLFGIIPINLEDDVLHAVIGVLGLAACLATPAEPPVGVRAARA